MSGVVIEGGAVATVDASGTEYVDGHVVVEGNRIAAVGPGAAPADVAADRRVDASGCLVTPGLVNTHHHFYQWLTRGMVQQANLFQWLEALYPVWAGLDTELEYAAARASLAALLSSGCSTTTDHHYVFPSGSGDLLAAEVEAARTLGVRFHPCRGSMDLGRSRGGLPPDEIVEDRDTVLRATETAIDRYHDPSPDAMLRVAVAPCSPFSVTEALLHESAELARRHGVRLHTHLAETLDEEEYCREKMGRTPAEYLDDLGWLGRDVWLAHSVHLDEGAVRRLGDTGTGVAHCPSSNARLGAGMAPVRALLDAAAPVGLGVDGTASHEAGQLGAELRTALHVARLRGGPQALPVRQALRLATVEGARCLGREPELGSLEPGKLADVAVWRLDDLGHAGIADPVAALVLGPAPRVELLLVNGHPAVEAGEPNDASVEEITRAAEAASRRLQSQAA